MLAYIRREKTQEVFFLHEQEQTLGRKQKDVKAAKADIEFDGVVMISRLHAKIFRLSDTWWLSDVGSKNGTKKNGEVVAIGKMVPLFNGDSFSLAEEETFSFHVEEDRVEECPGGIPEDVQAAMDAIINGEECKSKMNTYFDEAMEKTAIKVVSDVNKAVVYRKGAMITRFAEVPLKKGKNILGFVGVSSSVAVETVQVAMGEGVSCIQVMYDAQYRYVEKAEKIEMEPSPVELDELGEKRKKIANRLAVAEHTLELVLKNQGVIGREDFSMELLKEYVEYTATMQEKILEEIRLLKFEDQGILQDIKKIEDDYQERKRKLQSRENKVYEGVVWVEVEADEENKYPIELVYYNGKAHWLPFYDLHVDTVGNPLKAVLKGKVFQNTGESWTDIELRLSTGNMRQSNNSPELLPWILAPKGNRVKLYSGAPAASRIVEGAAQPVGGYGASGGETAILQEANMANKIWGANENNTTEQNEVTTEYSIAGRCSVYSDGTGTVLALSEEVLQTDYIYHVIPKAECSAFLTAHMPEGEKAVALEGDANIFLENRYVGATHVDQQRIYSDFWISLGRDKGVLVERKKMPNYQSKSFLGNVYKKDFAYQLWIKNGKDSPIKLIVNDQIPVSTDDRIHVEVLDVSNAILDEKTGKLSWNFSLDSQAECCINIAFRVSWAKDCAFSI